MNTIIFCGLYILPHIAKVIADGNDTSIPTSNSTEQRVDVAADALFDEYWQMTLMDYPEFATTIGDHRYDNRLTGYSLKCYEKRKVMMTEFLERANQLLPLAPEGSDTHDNIQLFIVLLQHKIDTFMSGSHLFPVSIIDTPQMSLRLLLKYVKLDEAKNYWDLISRYRAFPQKIDELIELMREGIRTNFTLYEKSLWMPESEEQNKSMSESPFYKPFLNISSAVPSDEADYIQRNATDAVLNSIYPALKKLDDFLENEYKPNTRPKVGVSSLPNGREFYRQELMRHLTDPTVTAEEIHAMGVAEVQRISEEMMDVIHSLGLNMTRKEFSDRLRNDETQFFQSEEEVLATYNNTIENGIYPRLPMLFKTIPEKKLVIEKIPIDMASGPRAFYMPPSPDNSTPAIFYLDTSSLKNLPRYEVVTLAIHEGVPGHHFQFSYAMEQNGHPDFRKYGVEITAYTEGWALYAEFLGYEMGLYEDLYMRYGHLSQEIFRACRMVVDTGIHVFGWSRQKAIEYMLEYSAETLGNIEREVDRYITWPGQACAYKYGELKIKQLRNKAATALGAQLDLKEFHDVILQNNGPLEIVEKHVDRYIQRTKNAALES